MTRGSEELRAHRRRTTAKLRWSSKIPAAWHENTRPGLTSAFPDAEEKRKRERGSQGFIGVRLINSLVKLTLISGEREGWVEGRG